MSTTIKTILYATDLGKYSRLAFKMAVKMSKEHNAKLSILSAVEPLSSSTVSLMNIYWQDESIEGLYKRSFDDIETYMTGKITAFCRELLGGEDFPGGEPDINIVEGWPDKEILREADKIDADLIVLGSHSHSRLESLFIGSVAAKVVNQSDRPVLLVPCNGG